MKEKLIQIGAERPESIEGCTPAEIEQVKLAQGVDFLPDLYQQFLLEMGHAAGHFYLGSNYKVSDLLKLKQLAKERLIEDGKTAQLPDDAFVFFMHHGYHFMYFLTADKQDDPPVHSYMMGENEPNKFYEKLSDHYKTRIEGLIKLKEKDRQQRLERMRRNNPNM